MLRRSFFYLLLVVMGTAGMWLWRENRSKAVADVEVSNARHSSPPPRQSVPSATRLDFITDLSQPYQVRINLLHNTLSSECSEPELRYLYQLLAQGAAAAEIPEHGYVIANDIMNQLLSHETNPQRFASNFTALLNDSHQPEVIRDYAVQYLVSWLNPRSAQVSTTALAAPSSEITAQVMKSLVTATIDPALGQTSIPGTTLMMLVDLTRSDSGVDCRSSIATLKPWLSRALGEGSTLTLAIRVSAVVAAGILAPEDFRPTLRKIAYQPDSSGALQLPALASLGQAGDATDLTKLQKVAATQPTLAYAAADACRTIAARLTSESLKISQ
jgi:hypothetical protein